MVLSFREIFEFCRLDEAYRRHTFPVKEIAKDLYLNRGMLSWEDDTLVSPAGDEHGITFKIDPSFKGTKLIAKAAYNTRKDEYTVTISPKFWNALKRQEPEHRLPFIAELDSILEHEYAHRQQNQLGSRNQKYVHPLMTPSEHNEYCNKSDDAYNEFRRGKYLKYLSQPMEIAAYARGVARKIDKKKDFDLNDYFCRMVIDDKFKYAARLKWEDAEHYLIATYKEIGGDVWKRFKKEFYNYFAKPHIGTESGYRDWLKSKRCD